MTQNADSVRHLRDEDDFVHTQRHVPLTADSRTVIEPIPGSGKCDHCEGTGADFDFNGHQFCCECMSELTSWILDGGMVENPDQFAYVLSPNDSSVTP